MDKREEKKQYVIGFLFRNGEVALIKKNRPEWQVGKLNGIGGHIEQGETPQEAMKREFSEEAGELIDEWQYYCTMNYPEADIYCFRLFGEYRIISKTDEIVSWYPVDALPENVIPNLHWLIPLACYDDDYLTQVSIKPDQILALLDPPSVMDEGMLLSDEEMGEVARKVVKEWKGEVGGGVVAGMLQMETAKAQLAKATRNMPPKKEEEKNG